MKLVDEDARLWYCEQDKLAFLAKVGGWIQDTAHSVGSPSLLSQGIRAKSYAVAIVVNFFPGGGVLYAGNWVGIIYPVLAVICLSVFPYAVVLVVLASYVHTCVAVRDHNRLSNAASDYLHSKSPAPLYDSARENIKPDLVGFSIPERGSRVNSLCDNCGRHLSESANYCPGCGVEVGGRMRAGSIPDIDKTRHFA